MVAEGSVPRRRLLDLLSPPPSLRVIAAPSGFGKTTLLRSWVDSLPPNRGPVVSVTLTSEVASRQDFWLLVATSAVRRGDLDPDAYSNLSRAIATSDDPVSVIAEFLGVASSLLLVIDAYEQLRSLVSQIDADLARLVAEVPGLDVVVATRAATQLADDLRVMRGDVRVISEAELGFTTDEVAQLVAIHAPHAASATEHIVRETRGYPLAVRAAVHALARAEKVPSFGSPAWQRLVTEDLLSQLADPALAAFVLDTSVPPYFDRSLACELVGTDDVDGALAELAWHGFGRWAPYAPDTPVFQYVESVRDVSSARLHTEQPDRYRRDAGLAARTPRRRSGDRPRRRRTPLRAGCEDLRQAERVQPSLLHGRHHRSAPEADSDDRSPPASRGGVCARDDPLGQPGHSAVGGGLLPDRGRVRHPRPPTPLTSWTGVPVRHLGTTALVNALAVLWLADGHPERGRALLRDDLVCGGQLAPARLLYLLVTDDPALALRSVADLLAEPGHTIRSAMAVETLGAAAARRVGNNDAALGLLAQAAARYRLYGARAQLMYLPQDDLLGLRELASRGGDAACIDYLAGDVVGLTLRGDLSPVVLSAREREVLKAWAVCSTRAEVANMLYVSTNTVKSQLRSAYRKLGVTTKDAAIQRALELDLLR